MNNEKVLLADHNHEDGIVKHLVCYCCASKELKDNAEPRSDCQICRVNYWLQRTNKEEAFRLAGKKLLKLGEK